MTGCMLKDSRSPYSGLGSQINAFCKHTDLEPIDCSCGEEETEFAWVWSLREDGGQAGSVVLGAERRQIVFNPEYSTGTATVRGQESLRHGFHHYWELKMTSAVYGTDIMVGVCTRKFDLNHGLHRFCSLLGRDTESWGYSYTGSVRHGGKFHQFGPRWGKGSIVGLHLDAWRGTLSFFLNRKPLGLAFSGLQNKEIYPIVSSTSAHSGMKLVTSCAFPSNLQFLASEAMFLHLRQENKVHPMDLPLPPGLRSFVENNFWPFLRSLGQQDNKVSGQKGEHQWLASGTKHPHDTDEAQDRVRAKRQRRKLLYHPPSPSSRGTTSPFLFTSNFINYSTPPGVPSNWSQMTDSFSSSSSDASPLVSPSKTSSSVTSPIASSSISSSVALSVIPPPLASSTVVSPHPCHSRDSTSHVTREEIDTKSYDDECTDRELREAVVSHSLPWVKPASGQDVRADSKIK